MKTYIEFINEIIVKSGDKFLVKTEDGSKVLGTHSYKKKAEKQLAAIEISKNK